MLPDEQPFAGFGENQNALRWWHELFGAAKFIVGFGNISSVRWLMSQAKCPRIASFQEKLHVCWLLICCGIGIANVQRTRTGETQHAERNPSSE
jgi:hypothetical protein